MTETFAKSIQPVVDALKSSGADEVYIFGSASKGTLREDSDIDLAVSGLPPEKFFKALSLASGLCERPLHLIDLDEGTQFTSYLKQEGELQRVG